MKKIVISKIFLEEIEEKNIRVCSNIKSDKQDYKLWFEVDNKYKDYILTEREDAFLVAILPYAIKKELDIVIEGKISSRLYYQLNTYLLPMLCEAFKKRTIQIQSELDYNQYNIAKKVGTGLTGGIDSLYTIAKHINLKEKEFNLTHLTFFNAGGSGQYGGEEARRLYKNRAETLKKFAEKYKFEFLAIDTNLNEFLMMDHLKTHTFRTLSCVLLLQKLFSKYYFSSAGYDFNSTQIDEHIAKADILVLQCLSTEDITFYSTGMEAKRMQKVKEVVKYEPSYDILNVCVNEEKNCGHCPKCKRTMLALDSIGKLDLYKNVFDINYFNKNKMKLLAWVLKYNRKKDEYCPDIYKEYKKNGTNFPLYVKLMSFLPTRLTIKKIVSKVKKKENKEEEKINDGWTD